MTDHLGLFDRGGGTSRPRRVIAAPGDRPRAAVAAYASGASMSAWHFEVYETWRGEWAWRFVSDQGHVLAKSTDNYSSEEEAWRALEGIKPRMAGATLRGRA